MKLIVTGGAGFIGGNFVHYMLQEHPGDQIICLDKLTYAGNLSTLADVMDHPNFQFVKMDICDRDSVYGLFEKEKPAQRRAAGAVCVRGGGGVFSPFLLLD